MLHNFILKNGIITFVLSRKVVGYKASTRNNTQLTKSTFRETYESKQIEGKLLFYSDQGVNYTSKAFRRYLAELGVKLSFPRARKPYDNSVIDSFFKNMKAEVLYRTKHHSEFRQTIDKYIDFYIKKDLTLIFDSEHQTSMRSNIIRIIKY